MSAIDVNCPYRGTISADGTAKIEAVQRETYTFTEDADYLVAGSLNSVLEYFTLSQETSGSSGVALNVAVSNASALGIAIAAALKAGSVSNGAAAVGAAAPVGAIETVLAKVHEDAFNLSLASNGVNAALEADVVKENAFTDFSGNVATGCDDLANEMHSDASDTLRLLATQLPAVRYDTANGEAFPTSIPFAAGDTLRIRFDISSTFTISTDYKDLTTSQGTPSNDANPAAAMGGSANGANTESWVVELVLTMA